MTSEPTTRPDETPREPVRSTGHLRVRTTPLRIVLVYVIVGAAWILLSDRLLFAHWGDAEMQERLSIAKGWFYVLATAALLYVLVRRNVEEVTRLGAEMSKVIESMGDAVLLFDSSRRVVAANQAAADLFGFSNKSELLVPVRQIEERHRPRYADGRPDSPVDSLVNQSLRGEAARSEMVMRRPDSSEVYVSVVCAPVRFRRGGEVSLAVAVGRDITERRQLEQMRNEFLQIAAHEFKTPLAVIKAYSQLIEKRGQADRPTLQVIHRQVDRLTRLTQQLLELSRLRTGGPELRRERYDLAEQAAQVVEGFQRTVTHRLTIEQSQPAPVLADRDRVEQVLLNLLDNAVRYSPRGGDIATRVERIGPDAVVTVRDHGLGIPREKQERVFERFYRAHAGTGDDYGGIGVGLDTSREIVLRHGGRMWFESEEGVGSTFFFSLPLAEGPPGGRTA